MLRKIQKKPETMRVSGFLKFFKYTYFLIIYVQVFR